MRSWILSFFEVQKRGSSLRTEALAGATTFLTMAYIIFVEPAVLSNAGMDFGAVMTATCLGAALICLLMAFIANYPIAGAPLMGENFFFAFTVVLAMQFSFQVALAAVLIEGIFFLILTLLKIREYILDAIPASLKHAMAVAIGLFIAYIGLRWSGIIVSNPSSGVALGNLKSAPVILSLLGILITTSLFVNNVRGALLWGIFISTGTGLAMGLITYEGIFAMPPSIAPVFMQFDFSQILNPHFITVVFLLLYMEIFDTIGTIIGVGEEGGFIKDNKLPNAHRVLMVDALGTSLGAVLGTSTVSSYIESNAGVTQGGRTGFTSFVTALFFLAALFLYPVVKMIGGGVAINADTILYPVIAPSLIIVGFLMLKSVKKIEFTDPAESIPAYLTIVGVPLTFSIADGIAFGLVSYPILKAVTGKWREVSPFLYIIALIFIARYAFL